MKEKDRRQEANRKNEEVRKEEMTVIESLF